MLPVIIASVVIGGIGYGVGRYLNEEECLRINYNDSTDTHEDEEYNALENLYTLNKKVFESTIVQFEKRIKQIENIKLNDKIEVVFQDNIPTKFKHYDKLETVASQLYTRLAILNTMLEQNLSQITAFVEVTTDYKSYSSNSRKIISDAMVMKNTIYDILNLKVVSKKGKPTKKAINTVAEVQKVIDGFD